MQRYTINQIRSELEQKRGEKFTDEQLKVLLSGFKARCRRRGLYSSASVDNAVSRGWMGAQMAHYFMDYALE